MRRFLWLLALPVLLLADDDKLTRGAAVYASTCAVAYCHGPQGTAGRAPALAARRMDPRAIVAIATQGIPNTSMPGFGRQIKPEDLEAVAAYIVSLAGSGAAGAGDAKPTATASTPAAVQQGRFLFSEAARTGACGACHDVGGRGIPVSLALRDLSKAHLGDLRALATPNVVTAHPTSEDPFPAVVAEKTAKRVRVYDLSAKLPVLRTFTPAEVAISPGTSWHHRDAVAIYTDAELEAISSYLLWVKEY
jgi:mono/diheme cytochrome c family protein